MGIKAKKHGISSSNDGMGRNSHENGMADDKSISFIYGVHAFILL